VQLAHQARGRRIAILGPSGSGKSLTLRALAGLLGPRVGAVHYGGEPVTDVPTEVRGIGYVPQGLGLFPGRPVWQQLCFAVDADQALAAWWLQTLQLDGLADRRPDQLSGGQRQRVGLAQALAHNPRLVLLDEPFSALDAPVREELRRELRRVQQETGLSTVLVTHDPEEAALLADEILVIDKGRLLQAGPRAEVYSRPASPEVARLLGIQNLTPGTVSADGSVRAGELQITVGAHPIAPQTPVLWCIRPDHVVIRRGGAYPARVLDIADIGTLTSVTVALLGGPELRVRTTEALQLAAGDSCEVDLDPAAITLWPVEASAAPAPVG
jgi:molybdate transport system permease protein